MPNEFVTAEYLWTFAGMILVLSLIVQFSKSLVKQTFTDQIVRVYAFLWALTLVAVMYWNQGLFEAASREIATTILLVLINAIIVTLASMGGYELVRKK